MISSTSNIQKSMERNRPMSSSPSSLLFSLWISSLIYVNFAAQSPQVQDKLRLPSFAVSWIDNRNTFQAGDVATIKIKPFDNSFNNSGFDPSLYMTNFSLSVSGKKGNSSYVSGVAAYSEGDADVWNISFVPIRSGDFSAVVTEEAYGAADSSLHFYVVAGNIYSSACAVSWTNSVDEFVAGMKAYVSVLMKDAFGNNISSTAYGPSEGYFKLSASFENGTMVNLLDARYNGWNELGLFGMEFVPATAGSLLVHVCGDNRNLSGSPLPFTVKPGSINITNSLAKWRYETNFLQVFSMLEILIYQRDMYGNLVPGFHQFDAEVVDKATNLSIPLSDLLFQEVGNGVQLVSFTALEPGDFFLTISSAKLNGSISSMPYHYTVFTGYCNASTSIVNGTGLFSSVAGNISYFTVYLEDTYKNPSPVESEWLHVQILSKNDSLNIHPVIFPLNNFTGNGTVSAESTRENTEYMGKSTIQASDFNVAYFPKKSGAYEVGVFCGNIPLNNGHTYLMTVSPGAVDTSRSSVVKYATGVKQLVVNEIVVHLLDSFSNPLVSHRTKLSIQISPSNGFSSPPFVDNEDGSYTGYYQARDIGAYNICVSVENKHLSPCPFEINVFDVKYFPEAHNDSISVWEDESTSFDVLSNDYASDGQATIIESTIPIHGSLLQYGKLFRYTPHIGFFGNDSFTYIISDKNKYNSTGTVFISVLCMPPQFVSLPITLHAIEDTISPKFGGFPGFEILYSDDMENISVSVRAKYGAIFLAPTHMDLWQPLGSRFSARKSGGAGNDLILEGNVETINHAMQLIQYIGNGNFYGNDIISLYTMNKNGIQDAHVPIFVDPINDPPIISVPKFIILGSLESGETFQIFDKQRDAFEFSIADPDAYNFPGNKSQFILLFSLEVNDGIISTSLPSRLLKTIELKFNGSNQWQPLQTYVTISNYFVLKGKAFRFRGTIGDCNKAMQQLFYQGGKDDDMLTIHVNDLGNAGCFPDCQDMMTLPLSTEATVNLIKRKPISSIMSLLLGTAIIVEILLTALLGGILLYYICKCMNILHGERREYSYGTTLTAATPLENQTGNIGSSKSLRYFDGISSSITQRFQDSNFRQRSCRMRKHEDPEKLLFGS